MNTEREYPSLTSDQLKLREAQLVELYNYVTQKFDASKYADFEQTTYLDGVELLLDSSLSENEIEDLALEAYVRTAESSVAYTWGVIHKYWKTTFNRLIKDAINKTKLCLEMDGAWQMVVDMDEYVNDGYSVNEAQLVAEVRNSIINEFGSLDSVKLADFGKITKIKNEDGSWREPGDGEQKYTRIAKSNLKKLTKHLRKIVDADKNGFNFDTTVSYNGADLFTFSKKCVIYYDVRPAEVERIISTIKKRTPYVFHANSTSDVLKTLNFDLVDGEVYSFDGELLGRLETFISSISDKSDVHYKISTSDSKMAGFYSLIGKGSVEIYKINNCIRI
jgi:hypothetical protein